MENGEWRTGFSTVILSGASTKCRGIEPRRGDVEHRDPFGKAERKMHNHCALFIDISRNKVLRKYQYPSPVRRRMAFFQHLWHMAT